MTIIHLPDDRDDARDSAIEAREWQAQERATRAERLQAYAALTVRKMLSELSEGETCKPWTWRLVSHVVSCSGRA